MTEREKLIDLMCYIPGAEEIADFFLANGVTIPVRCKDCVHWHEPEGVCLKIYSDGNVSPYAWQDRKPDDFCSYGKKKI